MIQIISFLSGIFKKENLKLLLFVGFAIFLFVFFQTCNQNSKLKQQIQVEKAEQTRIKNNWDASLDTLKQVRDAQGTLTAKITGYELTQKELAGKYSELFSSMQKFAKDWEKTPPVTIVETKYMITEKIKDFNVATHQDGAKGEISLSSDTTFSPGNSRSIKGSLSYNLAYFKKSDSTMVEFAKSDLYTKVNPFSPSFSLEQKMSLSTGVNKDSKTGKNTIWVTTDYPGVTFTDIKGAEIVDPNQQAKQFQKPRRAWGLGFSVGPGILYDPSAKKIVPGFYIGMGINFTPKKLQF